MEKSLEQLKQEYEKNLLSCWNRKTENAAFENRQAYRKAVPKQRTHLLITRGAAIESIAPLGERGAIPEFYSLMESILNLPQAGISSGLPENHAPYFRAGERR